ncbi:16677_t:CDS:2, partial [Gigaspora rosea]
HESDIQFVHYNKDMYLKQGDSQILPRDEQQFDNSSVDGVDIDDKSSTTLSHAEFKRKMHIKSEQKRRKEINDAFAKLSKQLPYTNTGRKMSKAGLIQKAVSHIENSLRKENMLLDKINRLNQNCLYLRAELEKEKRR